MASRSSNGLIVSPESSSYFPEASANTSSAGRSTGASSPSSNIRRNQGSHRRPSGEFSERSDIAVRTVPGLMANAETLKGFASIARHSVKRMRADLLDMYPEKY